MITKKMLGKEKVYAAFMDLRKAYDRVDWEVIWDILNVYGVGGSLMDGIKAFNRDVGACVIVKGEVGESCRIYRRGCGTRMCNVTG